nr:hypothetical protein [Mycobacterium malmoense]
MRGPAAWCAARADTYPDLDYLRIVIGELPLDLRHRFPGEHDRCVEVRDRVGIRKRARRVHQRGGRCEKRNEAIDVATVDRVDVLLGYGRYFPR